MANKRGRPRKERPEKKPKKEKGEVNNGWIKVKNEELRPIAKVTVIIPKCTLRLFIDLIEINGLGDKVKRRIKVPVAEWEKETAFKKYLTMGRNPSWDE